MPTAEITIGQYLLERLKQIGVRTMFGVPGDFNLGFLDLVEDDPDITWVGNCNELNAAYAADGYARVKHQSVGALLTTFGVGELSALNGIAGSYAEMTPIVHIVGIPNRMSLQVRPILHHTLADGRFDVYMHAAKAFTAAQTLLSDEANAASEIDRVLAICIEQRRPVYLAIPIDLVQATISTGPLSERIRRLVHVNDVSEEANVIDEVERLVREAHGSTVILVDVCSLRKDAQKETQDFVKKTGLPVYALPMGKAIIDEDYERYGGIYVGAFSRPEVREAVESAKLVLSIGTLKTDFNTGIFTAKLPSQVVEFHSTLTKVLDKVHPSIGMKGLLPKLADRLEGSRPASCSIIPFKPAEVSSEGEPISQHWFWPRLAPFLRPKDIVVTETGTASFGIWDVPFPPDSLSLSQTLYGSIGYTVGATLGAAVAGREVGGRRTILFIGDGSLQVGVQELSTMLRTGVRPIIFVL